MDSNWELTKNIDFDYIEKNYNSNLTLYLLWHYGKLFDNYEKLSTEVRNGPYKSLIDYEIRRNEMLAKKDEIKALGTIGNGNVAPDFTLKTINNSKFNLYNTDYEFMVLDFWGSWCLPCIKGFPQMKTYYEKYGDRIEFIGIACKDSEDRWKESVKKHDVNWIQLLNDSDESLDVSLKYAVLNYPTKVIIDKEKKIVGVFEGESEEFYKKLDDLMKSK